MSATHLNLYTCQVTGLKQELKDKEEKLEAKEVELQRAQAEVDYIFVYTSHYCMGVYGEILQQYVTDKSYIFHVPSQ